jgi:hypothetical protein
MVTGRRNQDEIDAALHSAAEPVGGDRRRFEGFALDG